MNIEDSIRVGIRRSLDDEPGAVLEHIAAQHDVSGAEVIASLPEGQAMTLAGDRFEEVMLEIAEWGNVTFLVHNEDLVLEARGTVPKGSTAHGYYNLHGRPIGGHLRVANCGSISFVSRKLFDNDTHSVQFLNKDGGWMFKIYLGRDEERNLIPEQIEKFTETRNRLATASSVKQGE